MRTAFSISTGLLSRMKRSVATFGREEDGATMTALLLIWMILLIPAMGYAIEVTRAEHLRTRVQGTLDRAVLAAADIDQTLPPRDVVLDYFQKAGLGQFISAEQITVTPDDPDSLRTGRTVSAWTRAYFESNLTTFGGDLVQWGAPAASGAEEAKSDIEVVMVLDVSGSMGSNNKLSNLKVAAREFVDTVLQSETAEGSVSIAIVPYNGQVNARRLLPYYTVTGDHTYGSCINFQPSQFQETALPPTTSVLPRANVFDPWYSSRNITLAYCPLHAFQELMPSTNNATRLKNHISGFQAEGNTSLDIGMRWGALLVDPSFRPVNVQLVAAGEVPPEFAILPFDYGARSTAKYIILMSDGQNTDEYVINDPYRSGLSPIYKNSSGALSIYHAERSGSSKYYRLNSDNSGTWTTSPWSGSTQLKWPDVWANHPINFIAKELYSDAWGWSGSQRNAFIASVRGATAPSVKDLRTSQICTATKQKNVTVFTIGFEAPAAGLSALRDCATSPGHFFDVNGVEISEAFQVIARRISELRLTQ